MKMCALVGAGVGQVANLSNKAIFRTERSNAGSLAASQIGDIAMKTKARLGVCTWTFGEMPLQEIARRLSRLGFDGVELMGDLKLYTAQEAAQIMQDHGLTVFSLTPENVDLAHPDAAVRAEVTDYYLRLSDFAAEFGKPIVSCHGYVGRVRALSSMAQERAWFVEGVRQIAGRAQALGLRVAMEVLNRYESHLLNTAAEALDFVTEVSADNLGILLDAYHMNIEESHPAAALRQVGERLFLYHVADSNRQGVGRGHTDFAAQMDALADIGYTGPIILECTAPGPDPFTAIKDENSLVWLETYHKESRAALLATR
jgi:D-psicose/D-tagatose/L-ribulose 3-epimerase